MPDNIDNATTALREFSKTGKIDALERAVDSLEEFDIWSIKPDQRLGARRRLLLEWSRVLHAIDGVKEPGFNPESNPTSRYPPPPSGYPAGVTPQAVRDSQARARYEAAIAENEKKRDHRKTQMLAEALDQRSIQAAHRAVERLYTSSAADQKEIDAVFKEAGLTSARRQEVLNPTTKKPPEP